MGEKLPTRGVYNTICVHFESPNSERTSQYTTNLQFARFGKELKSGILYEYNYLGYEIVSETVIKLGPSGSGRWIEP